MVQSETLAPACSILVLHPASGDGQAVPGSSMLLLHRKAIEGLVALSEDGCSPISIQQMAYGECCAEWGTPTAGPGASPGRAGHGAGGKRRVLTPELVRRCLGCPWVAQGLMVSLSRQWLVWALGS